MTSPTRSNSAVLSIAPLIFPIAERGRDLELRVSAPVAGDSLPVILFSHGNGQSLHTYGPLVHFWASHGFVVIQPTHLDSRTIGMAHDDPRYSQLWRHREKDLVDCLDRIDAIEAMVPALQGRLDRDRIAVAGHSWGAQTASLLLGARHPDPDDGSTVSLRDDRVKAGVLLTLPGSGGDKLSDFARTHLPFMHPDFSAMTTPALIVAGDHDQSALTHLGPEWWREGFDLSPGAKALLTLFGAEHSLGGISNYEARETTDESPARVAALQTITTAWLRLVLDGDAEGWAEAKRALGAATQPEGAIDEKA